MPTARSDLGVAVVGNKLYAVGGYYGDANLSTVEVFDPQRGVWEAGPPMAMARHFLGVVAT